MINSEDDVRAWVRGASGGRARWVEPALGSTPGLPDCWVPMECGRQVHLELKAGVITGEHLRFSIRPEQRREIRQMLSDRVGVGLAIGIKGSATVVFAKATDKILSGSINLSSVHFSKNCLPVTMHSVGGFWSGVNFIFSDFQKAM